MKDPGTEDTGKNTLEDGKRCSSGGTGYDIADVRVILVLVDDVKVQSWQVTLTSPIKHPSYTMTQSLPAEAILPCPSAQTMLTDLEWRENKIQLFGLHL